MAQRVILSFKNKEFPVENLLETQIGFDLSPNIKTSGELRIRHIKKELERKFSFFFKIEAIQRFCECDPLYDSNNIVFKKLYFFKGEVLFPDLYFLFSRKPFTSQISLDFNLWIFTLIRSVKIPSIMNIA